MAANKKSQKIHWTAEDTADFVFSVGADFVGQVEVKLERANIPQRELAKKLKVSPGRVSQLLNNPGNLELKTIVDCALALGLKASIVLYDDDDHKKEYGPLHPDVFRTCWEMSGKPKDAWSIDVIPSKGYAPGAGLAIHSQKSQPTNRSLVNYGRLQSAVTSSLMLGMERTPQRKESDTAERIGGRHG